MNKSLRTRLFAWWYFAIAAGFVLLAINRWMLGERITLILLRLLIALGFLILGVLTWRLEDLVLVPAQSEGSNALVEIGPLHAEGAGGAGNVPAGFLQRPQDVVALG